MRRDLPQDRQRVSPVRCRRHHRSVVAEIAFEDVQRVFVVLD